MEQPAQRPRTGLAEERPAGEHQQRIVYIDPKRCRPWPLADRIEADFSHLDDLTAAIQEDGQIVPVIVRPLKDDPLHDYEIVAGNARYRAALKAGVPLAAIIRTDLDDRSAWRIMVQENELRQPICPYAQGLRCRQALQKGLFKSKRELARVLGISSAQIEYLLGIADLPKELVAVAGPDIKRLSARMGYELVRLVAEGASIDVLVSLMPMVLRKEIDRQQLRVLAAPKRRTPPTLEPEKPVQAVRRTARGIAITLSEEMRSRLDDRTLATVKLMIEDVLTRATGENDEEG